VIVEEISEGSNYSFAESILGTFGFTEEIVSGLLANFDRELQEIGSNRVIFRGMRSGRAVSTVQLILQNADNDPELANGMDAAHFHALWVSKDLHRQGIGERMMMYCEEYARSRSFILLTLGVDDSNPAALRLYQKLGYSVFKEEPGRNPSEKLLLMRKGI